MSQILFLIQSPNPFGKLCLWPLMIAISELQSTNCKFINFHHLEKYLITREAADSIPHNVTLTDQKTRLFLAMP